MAVVENFNSMVTLEEQIDLSVIRKHHGLEAEEIARRPYKDVDRILAKYALSFDHLNSYPVDVQMQQLNSFLPEDRVSLNNALSQLQGLQSNTFFKPLAASMMPAYNATRHMSICRAITFHQATRHQSMV